MPGARATASGQTGGVDTFDPTHGHDLDALLEVGFPPGPKDFVAFWRETYAAVRAIPLKVERRPVKSTIPGADVWIATWDSLGGVRVGGWIVVPKDGVFERGAVVGHGYGGREAPDGALPGPATAAIFPCARGFHLSAQPGIPNQAGLHVVRGLESRESYIHRGCVADFWTGASVLEELYPAVQGRLDYLGGSFGGGIGAMLLPWDARFRRAYLDVPSFGNHPLRVTMKCTGSGEAIRQIYLTKPEIMEVLQYFDAATAAHYVNIPVFVAAAVSDPSVPPPGQFAVYNAIRSPKELFVRLTGHPDTPADNEALRGELVTWFNEV